MSSSRQPQVAVVDYGTGNLRSVACALGRIGATYTLTSDPDTIRSASHVLLPGVGEAATAMQRLQALGLDRVVATLEQPVLGICIGMQLMCLSSDEGGGVECMGLFDTRVRRLAAAPGLKIPHMGWDTLQAPRGPLFDGLPEGTWVYYVHSYAADVCADTSAVTAYATPWSAALSRGRCHGVQFHPEKSGPAGARLLRNFLSL